MVNLADAAIANAPSTAVVIRCTRCGRLRVPRHEKALCGPCAAVIEALWDDVTPVKDPPCDAADAFTRSLEASQSAREHLSDAAFYLGEARRP
jgi:hypothetical protein